MELKRILRSKVLLSVFVLSLAWTLSLFIAPMTIPPGTVTDLDGSSNRVDYPHLWDDMPLYPRIIYYIGDAQCHQKWYRTFFINGNEMPVDSRVTAIYVGLSLGILASMLVAYATTVSGTFISILPSRAREFVDKRMDPRLFLFLFMSLAFAPLVIDGFTQLLTAYESTNLTRVLTGLPLGFAGGYMFGVLIGTLHENRKVQKEFMKEEEHVHEMMRSEGLSERDR
jgi:uncharacterized membrane protein